MTHVYCSSELWSGERERLEQERDELAELRSLLEAERAASEDKELRLGASLKMEQEQKVKRGCAISPSGL